MCCAAHQSAALIVRVLYVFVNHGSYHSNMFQEVCKEAGLSSNSSGLVALVPPLGLGMRSANAAAQLADAQSERTEAAGEWRWRGHPAPRQGAMLAPWNPLLSSHDVEVIILMLQFS
jgi:hypothetical protein